MKIKMVYVAFILMFGCKVSSESGEISQMYNEILKKGLENEFYVEGKDVLLLQDSTINLSGYYSKLVKRYSPKNKKESTVIDALINENKNKIALNDLDLNELVTEHKLSFESKNSFPQSRIAGVVGLSQIYFTESKDFCVVYLTFYCGGECGSGKLIFLEKKNSLWVVTNIHTLYLS